MVAVSYREHVFVLRVVQKCLTRRPTALPAFKRCYVLVGASVLWLSCTEHITWLCFWEGSGDSTYHGPLAQPSLPSPFPSHSPLIDSRPYANSHPDNFHSPDLQAFLRESLALPHHLFTSLHLLQVLLLVVLRPHQLDIRTHRSCVVLMMWRTNDVPSTVVRSACCSEHSETLADWLCSQNCTFLRASHRARARNM